jgi:hypothetical protein
MIARHWGGRLIGERRLPSPQLSSQQKTKKKVS